MEKAVAKTLSSDMSRAARCDGTWRCARFCSSMASVDEPSAT